MYDTDRDVRDFGDYLLRGPSARQHESLDAVQKVTGYHPVRFGDAAASRPSTPGREGVKKRKTSQMRS